VSIVRFRQQHRNRLLLEIAQDFADPARTRQVATRRRSRTPRTNATSAAGDRGIPGNSHRALNAGAELA
jgi:hypothetical protein